MFGHRENRQFPIQKLHFYGDTTIKIDLATIVVRARVHGTFHRTRELYRDQLGIGHIGAHMFSHSENGGFLIENK